MCKKIFVFGTGRCGTKSLYELFRNIPEGIVLHEGIGFVGQQSVNLGDFKNVNKIIYYDSNKSALKEVFNHSFSPRQTLISNLGKFKFYCDINPYGYNYIDHVRESYPDAYFIHLIRNGYDVVESYLKRNFTYPHGLLESKYTGYAAGKPRPLVGDESFYKWRNFNRVEKTSWFWKYVNFTIEEKMKLIPNSRKAQLRIEDLSSNPKYIIDILNILEINFDKNNLNIPVENSSNKSTTIWNSNNLNSFNKINKNLIIKYNYEIRK